LLPAHTANTHLFLSEENRKSYSVSHNNTLTYLYASPSEWECMWTVCPALCPSTESPLTLLFWFTSTFTEPLSLVFWVCWGFSVSLCDLG
ncbi:hypothetical protein Z043_125195, partial [Scleropages formosus]